MVKADAYGLGMARAVSLMSRTDPWGWGVACVTEGVRLREIEPTRPILVFSPAAPDEVARGVEAGLTFCVSDVSFLEAVAREATARDRRVSVHLEVDTGMGRAGLDWRTVGQWGPAVDELVEGFDGRVRWEGTFTHFHSADDADDASSKLQVRRFEEVLQALPHGRGGMAHLCNSAGGFRMPHLAGRGTRPGIFLYGGVAGAELPQPEEVVALRGRMALVREVPEGTTVGYGASYRAQRRERWATVGIGYGDGLRRALSNRGQVLVGGKRVPIVGRISMDMTVVEITDLPTARPGDVVTFLGSDGDDRITLEEMASLAETNNYEILTGFTPRLPRIWSEEPGGDGVEGNPRGG
jgi:alanine racemase